MLYEKPEDSPFGGAARWPAFRAKRGNQNAVITVHAVVAKEFKETVLMR